MIKLLFVEDDDSCAYAIKGGLELLDTYEIQHAENGKEAIEIFDSFKPDVVVSDVDMPLMNGYELAKKIREKETNVIIILASGLTSPKDLRQGYEIDIDEYVKKPYIADELHFRIQAILRRAKKYNKDEKEISIINNEYTNIGTYKLDEESLNLFFKNELVQKLTQREADILTILWTNRNSIVNRTLFLDKFWQDDDPKFASRSLDVFISKLRNYLSKDDNIKIENIRGKGLIMTI